MKLNITKKDTIYLSIIAILVALLITSAILFTVHCEKSKKTDENPFKIYYDNKVFAFNIQNANASKGQIVFIGDSITDLYPLDDYYADLDLACYNRGIGGDVTQGVIDRLQISVFDIKPSKIVLMIGTNDVDSGKDNGYIVSNYRKILDEIKKNQPSVELYFMSVIPQNKVLEESSDLDVTKNNEQIKLLNKEIKSLCEEYGYTYVDIFSRLPDGDGYLDPRFSDDGLHLNAKGFEVWTSLIKKHLKE